MNSGELDHAADARGTPTGDSASVADRRDFLSTVSTVTMAGGLLAGYGTLAVMAGRYIFPVHVETPWLFVAEANRIAPGDSLAFESPTGVRVAIARRPAADPSRIAETDDFLALSSVCPHLGCRVHWESQNQRFFCPCHNGVFDPQGKPVSGPPKAASQELPRYPLKVEGGLLYIAMSVASVGNSSDRPDHAVCRPNSSVPADPSGQEEMT